jgi:predicted ATPase
MESAYGGRSLHEQSHGESFLALFMDRFYGGGFYILDEPEAALSPGRQLSVLTRMHDLVREQSQFLIATHSPILMGYPGRTSCCWRRMASGAWSTRKRSTTSSRASFC